MRKTILIVAVVLILLTVYRRRVLNPTLDHRIVFGLMIGGICGNLIDRVKAKMSK